MLKSYYYKWMEKSHRAAAIKQLRRLEKKLLSRQARFAVPFVFKGRGEFKRIEPRQNPFEIESLYRMVTDINPQRVLEIGTARGGTLYLWTQAAAEDATLVSVDLPQGDFGGAYPKSRVPFYQSFARQHQRLTLLRTDSHLQGTLEQVRDLFHGEPIDFAFIDGDHTYEGVKKDFEMYGPMVRKGGLIAFHDILPRPDMPEIQVDRFWNELKLKYNTVDFVGSSDTGRAIGIGVLKVE